MGIVDLDAVPEDKGHVPLGEDDNPIPLVEFTKVTFIGRRAGPAKRTSGVEAAEIQSEKKKRQRIEKRRQKALQRKKSRR